MTPVDEAVERVRGYVESWDGFDDGTIISDNCDPNDLILSDLRALLSALELGSVASLPVKAGDEHATPSLAVLLADRPLGRLLPAVHGRAWQEIDRIFGRTGLPNPPVRLRDELVTHLLWARYGEQLHAALSASTTDSGRGRLDAEGEAYALGKRDGYQEAVQDIDVATGGDGEYRFCTNYDPDRHTPDAAAMKARIIERFAALSPTTPQGEES